MLFFQPACPVPLVLTCDISRRARPQAHPKNHQGNFKSRIIPSPSFSQKPNQPEVSSTYYFFSFLLVFHTPVTQESDENKVSMTSLPPSLSIRFIWVLFNSKDEPNTRDARRIIFKISVYMRKNWSQQRAQEPRGGLNCTWWWRKASQKKAYRKNRKPEADWGRGWACLHPVSLLSLLFTLSSIRHCGKSESLILNMPIPQSRILRTSPIPPSKTLLKYHGLSKSW